MNNRDERRPLLAMAKLYDHLILQIKHLDMQAASHPLKALAAQADHLQLTAPAPAHAKRLVSADTGAFCEAIASVPSCLALLLSIKVEGNVK